MAKPARAVVECIDLYPTLCELCGLPRPAGWKAAAFAVAQRPQAKWDHPAYTVWSEDGKTLHGVAVRTEMALRRVRRQRQGGAMLSTKLPIPTR